MTTAPPKPLNLQIVTERFAAAVEAMELAWVTYKAARDNRPALARYLRSLRRCDRLRQTLDHLLKTGNL
jgi:hypothetical protein